MFPEDLSEALAVDEFERRPSISLGTSSEKKPVVMKMPLDAPSARTVSLSAMIRVESIGSSGEASTQWMM